MGNERVREAIERLDDGEVVAVILAASPGTPTLTCQIAQAIAPLIAQREREAAARAWDEGHRHRQRRGPDECRCAAYDEGECGCGLYGTGPLVSLADNPYRD